MLLFLPRRPGTERYPSEHRRGHAGVPKWAALSDPPPGHRHRASDPGGRRLHPDSRNVRGAQEHQWSDWLLEQRPPLQPVHLHVPLLQAAGASHWVRPHQAVLSHVPWRPPPGDLRQRRQLQAHPAHAALPAAADPLVPLPARHRRAVRGAEAEQAAARRQHRHGSDRRLRDPPRGGEVQPRPPGLLVKNAGDKRQKLPLLDEPREEHRWVSKPALRPAGEPAGEHGQCEAALWLHSHLLCRGPVQRETEKVSRAACFLVPRLLLSFSLLALTDLCY